MDKQAYRQVNKQKTVFIIVHEFSSLPCAWGLILVPSHSHSGTYSLSVRDYDPAKGDHIKHYRIRKLDNDSGYYITQRSQFQTLLELVKHYERKSPRSAHIF